MMAPWEVSRVTLALVSAPAVGAVGSGAFSAPASGGVGSGVFSAPAAGGVDSGFFPVLGSPLSHPLRVRRERVLWRVQS